MKHQTRGKQRKKKWVSSESPRTAEEFFAMPRRIQRVYKDVLNVIGRMREGISRSRAMRELGVTKGQMERFGRSAFRKVKNRWIAKAYDHLLRVVMVVSQEGLREVATRDSRQASKAGKHSSAVHRYLETGDASGLLRLKDAYIVDAEGKRVALLTDLEELDRLGSAGVLSFESLYARSL